MKIALVMAVLLCGCAASERNRPLVGVNEISIESFSSVSGTANASLAYTLTNGGKSPAYVFIQGDVVESTAELAKGIDFGLKAQGQCDAGRASFSRHPITSIPGIPTVYGIVYDGQKPDSTSERMKAIPLTVPDPAGLQYYFLVHVGCVLYQSTAGGTVYQMPFKAYMHIRGSVVKVHGPWAIGNGD